MTTSSSVLVSRVPSLVGEQATLIMNILTNVRRREKRGYLPDSLLKVTTSFSACIFSHFVIAGVIELRDHLILVSYKMLSH